MKKKQTLTSGQDGDLALATPAETRSAALPKKSAISIQPYCPSKTFIARSGINPLIASASALFSLIAKLRHTEHYENVPQLRADLVHEVKAFECAAIGRHYQAEKVLLARYVICATLDEAILQTSWGMASEWTQYSLVKLFDDDEISGERVFLLLDKLRHKTKDSIDLIEFFYVCLSLGFEGKYRFIDNGHQSLDRLLDDLYRMIRRERGDSSAFLSPTAAYKETVVPKKIPRLPLKRIILATGLVLAIVYFSFIMMLHIEIQPIYQLLSVIGTSS